MKKMNVTSSFIVLFLLSFIIFPVNLASAAGSISEGSGVATITLEGMNREEAKDVLQEHIEAWQAQGPIEAESDYETVYIPRELFLFDIERTLDELEERTKREWSNFFIKPKNVIIPLHTEISPAFREEVTWSDGINMEQTLGKALLLAENLREGSIEIEYHDDAIFEQITLAERSGAVSEELSLPTVGRLAEELDEKVIASEESFSFLDELVLPDGMPNAKEEMSFIASFLYELSLHTELEIVERHSSQVFPTFTEPGLEAMVDRKNEQNLLLYNPTTVAYTIEAEMVENELVMAISTTKQEADVTYTITNEKEIAPRTIYRYSEDLTGEEEQIVSEGSPGLQLEVHRIVNQPGEEGNRELLARDFYPPEHRVVMIAGVMEEVEEEPAPVESPTDTLFDGATFEERGALIEACEGDPACEAQYQITSFEKMMLQCFLTESSGEISEDGEIVEEAGANPLCDFLYTTFFLYLLSNEGLLENTETEMNEEWMEIEQNIDIDADAKGGK